MAQADIDIDRDEFDVHAVGATTSPLPYISSGSSIMRGKLVRSAEPGVPSIPFMELMLPDCAEEMLRPRTIAYEGCNILPHEHESIRLAVLNAFRRHFQWRNDEAPYVEFIGSMVEVTLATDGHWDLVLEGLGWDENGELREIVIRTSGPYRTMHFVTSHEGWPHKIVVLALKNLPLDYDSRQIHDELAKAFCGDDNAIAYDSWDLVLGDETDKAVNQRMGIAIVVGETKRTYFEDSLARHFPRTLRYHGRDYPLECLGGRPRPKEAEGSSSTGALHGELPGDTEEHPMEID